MRREVEMKDDVEEPPKLVNHTSKFIRARSFPERYVDKVRLFVISEAILSSTTASSLTLLLSLYLLFSILLVKPVSWNF